MHRIILSLVMVGLLVMPLFALVDRSSYDNLTTLRDSALVLEAPVFAPRTWEKAAKKFVEAEKAVETNRKQKMVDKKVAEAREYVENAIKACEVAKLSLQQYLPYRIKAKQAKAPSLVPQLYTKAEEQFIKAAKKVESGDVKGALKEAEKSESLFDLAELEAIRVDILSKADKLIEKALSDDAGKFALSTFDKAKSAREKANQIITADRYNREEATRSAELAEYEARHASNIALSVRALKRNDQAWEKLMLVYEIQMNRIGQAAGFPYLPFDNGPLAAADTLIQYINNQLAENQRLQSERVVISSQLEQILEQVGASVSDEDDPTVLAEVLGNYVTGLLAEKQELVEQVANSQEQLTSLSNDRKKIVAELETRLQQEEKIKKAKRMLNPSEGEVLLNASNDVVLRLSGLSFDVGKAEIKDEHVPLLEKVKTIIEMFPDAQLVVEGHTDASGDANTNQVLSEKRAYAVMQYLRQSLLLPADKIRAIGYGPEKPIASNASVSGRAKNRRIDIIVMR